MGLALDEVVGIYAEGKPVSLKASFTKTELKTAYDEPSILRV